MPLPSASPLATFVRWNAHALTQDVLRGLVSEVQVLDALPDEEFSLSLNQPSQLLNSTEAALALPALWLVNYLHLHLHYS